jgi:hypothetical protein
MDNQVPVEVIKSRFQSAKIAAITASYLYRDSFRNRTLYVLV